MPARDLCEPLDLAAFPEVRGGTIIVILSNLKADWESLESCHFKVAEPDSLKSHRNERRKKNSRMYGRKSMVRLPAVGEFGLLRDVQKV